jgi:hypothetical protein
MSTKQSHYLLDAANRFKSGFTLFMISTEINYLIKY